MSSAIACAARSSGRTSLRPPPRFPTGVRTPPTMNASLIHDELVCGPWREASRAWFVFTGRAVHRPPKYRHEQAILIPDAHAIISESVGEALLFGHRRERVAHRHRLWVRNRVLDGDGDLAVRVARERERAVGQRVRN